MSLDQQTQDALTTLLQGIQAMFKPGAKITLFVRNPELDAQEGEKDGNHNILITDDDIPTVIQHMQNMS